MGRVIRWDEWRGSLDGRPTLWIRRFLHRPWLNVDLHKMVAADDPDCFHTHPAYAFRIVLWGGYVEEIEGGERRTWRPGMIGLVKPSLSHRIAELRNGTVSYSLWIRFRHPFNCAVTAGVQYLAHIASQTPLARRSPLMPDRVKPTEARLRALREIEKETRPRSIYPSKSRPFSESSYPVAASACFFAGWLDRIHQSETCRPSRRRYFFEYRLLPAGRALLANAKGE